MLNFKNSIGFISYILENIEITAFINTGYLKVGTIDLIRLFFFWVRAVCG